MGKKFKIKLNQFWIHDEKLYYILFDHRKDKEQLGTEDIWLKKTLERNRNTEPFVDYGIGDSSCEYKQNEIDKPIKDVTRGYSIEWVMRDSKDFLLISSLYGEYMNPFKICDKINNHFKKANTKIIQDQKVFVLIYKFDDDYSDCNPNFMILGLGILIPKGVVESVKQ